MKSVFIREIGIHPWDQVHPNHDERYITITLLNHEYEGAWKTWCKFASLLTPAWPKIVQWHTKLLPHCSRSQEYISQKKFYRNSKPGDILRKNESTNIYSQIINLDPDPFRIDPSGMTSYRTTVALMQKNDGKTEHLWHKLSNLTDISHTDDFKLILSDETSISFRFYDAETHGAAQLICHANHSPLLDEAIKKINLEEIQQKDIYAYIHT